MRVEAHMSIPETMMAMVLEKPGAPLVRRSVPVPTPNEHQILVKVHACGVCRTDLHVVDGELEHSKPHVIPGHEIVGGVVAVGSRVQGHRLGDRVGIPWLAHTCGHCRYCNEARENLCDTPEFTGYTVDGGYAEYVCADADYCFTLPEGYADASAAPLLCAGLIGYRSWKFAGSARLLGLYGFGAAAHLVIQMARHAGQEVYAFTRDGDTSAQEFARSLGAVWAGSSESAPPDELDAAIIFAPVGALVPQALRAVAKGGVVVLGGIHMSEIPAMEYSILWGERSVRSVANLTRRDAIELLDLAPRIPLKTEVTTFDLADANTALDRLRSGALTGAAVLVP
jgi:propanol-preferring alcohol dehydrogenase